MKFSQFILNNIKVNPIRVFNIMLSPWVKESSRPVFFNIEETCPELQLLDINFEHIQQELKKVLSNKKGIPYHEFDKSQAKLSFDQESKKKWNTFFFTSLIGDNKEAKEICPLTFNLVSQVPNTIQAFFSILESGKSIPKHKGPYRGYIRYHLALMVPNDHPPTFHIHDTVYEWKEGESILFDDGFEHEVRNQSEYDRVILIIDILRPLPRLGHGINCLMKEFIGFLYKKLLITGY